MNKWLVEITVEGLTDDVTATYDDMPSEFGGGTYNAGAGQQWTTWRVHAATAITAMHEAERIWRHTFGAAVTGLEPIGLTARTEGEHQRHNMQILDMAGELMTITQIADKLGVSHQRASKLAQTDPEFPQGAQFGGRTLYLKFLVDLYVKARLGEATAQDTAAQ